MTGAAQGYERAAVLLAKERALEELTLIALLLGPTPLPEDADRWRPDLDEALFASIAEAPRQRRRSRVPGRRRLDPPPPLLGGLRRRVRVLRRHRRSLESSG